MAIVLNINDMLDAATELAQNEVADPQRVAAFVAQLETAAGALASYLAEVTGVTHVGPADYQAGFGGLCANFYEGPNGEQCDVIAAGDEGGEWERHGADPRRATWEQAEVAGYAVHAPLGDRHSFPPSITFTLPGGGIDPSNRTFISVAFARAAAANHLEETR